VALRPDSPSFDLAVKLGFNVIEIGSREFYSDSAYALLTPDLTHDDFLVTHSNLFAEGTIILYAHGFSLLKNEFHLRYPHLQHVLYAPKSIGSELRTQYVQKGKLGAVYSLEHFQGPTSEIEGWIFELAKAMGINLGPFKTNFQDETQADLFSEQGLLCSLIPYAANEVFSQLIQKGISPELAYFECWHELKLIIDAMVDRGPDAFFDLISPNALVGSEKGYQKLFTSEFKSNMASLWKDIQDGTFNAELENTNVEETRKKIRQRWQKSELQKTFDRISR
jgi:ketol-acid reductoisomerase